jgi:protein-S-isoprenylcysteine O-methyltransferase Ste14
MSMPIPNDTQTIRGMPARTRMIVGPSLQPAIFALLLFAGAETWAWWRAWLLVAVVFVGSAVSFTVIARKSPALLAERLQGPLQAGQPLADRIILIAYLVAFAAVIAFIPFDVFHLHLLPPPSRLVSTLGLALFVAGWTLASVALRTNVFAAPVVKTMAAQTVVDDGVYAVVRHPMYAGVVLLLLGMPLWLESWAALLLACVPIALLVARVLVEERFLRAALPAYAAYAARVRFRLMPGVW